MLFEEIAMEEGLITKEQVEEALALQKSSPDYRMEEILVFQGLITNQQQERILAKQQNPQVSERYEICEKIAQGGMGVVYKAWDQYLEREVAIKVLQEKRDLQQEKLACKIQHPNIITVYDVFLEKKEGKTCIVMEWMKTSLAKKIEAEKPLSWERARPIMLALAKGLACAHKQGIIHCDIKPQNILLSSQGKPKIADFGLAMAVGSGLRGGGTFAYASPEQKEGKEPTPASDIYSLGITYYYMLTGEIWEQHQPFTYLFSRLVPKLFLEILQKMLEENPSKRFSCGKELYQALQKTPSVNRDPPIGSISKRTKGMLAGLILLVTILGSWVAFQQFTWNEIAYYQEILGNANEPIQKREKAFVKLIQLGQTSFRGIRLEKASSALPRYIKKLDLQDADLSFAYLQGRHLSWSDLSRASLQGANLATANLFDTNLSKCNLYGANLSGAYLEKANLQGAYLREALLYGANFKDADLSNVASQQDKDGQWYLTVDQLGQAACIENIRGLSREFLIELKKQKPELMQWWLGEP